MEGVVGDGSEGGSEDCSMSFATIPSLVRCCSMQVRFYCIAPESGTQFQ